MKSIYQMLKLLVGILLFCVFTNGVLYASHPKPHWCGNYIQNNSHGQEWGETTYLTSSNDLFLGLGGSDTIWGGYGSDCINGNKGNDVIRGENGKDYLHGGQDDDFINGNDGEDFIYGDDGNDELHGGKKRDEIFGDYGDDILIGGCGNDILRGESGNDTYYYRRGDGVDTIYDSSIHRFIFKDILEEEVSPSGNTLRILTKGHAGSIYFANGIRGQIVYSQDNRYKPAKKIIWVNDGDAAILDGSLEGARTYYSKVSSREKSGLNTFRWLISDHHNIIDSRRGIVRITDPIHNREYRLWVYNPWGCYYEDYYTVKINPVVKAFFTVDRDKGPAPLTVKFTNTSTVKYVDEPITYFWTFDNGGSITTDSKTITRTFHDKKDYHVRLEVRGGNKPLSSYSRTIYVDKPIVRDTTPPVVRVYDKDNKEVLDILAEEGSEAGGAKVTFRVTVQEDNPSGLVATCTDSEKKPVKSGDLFPWYETEVTCQAIDNAGNTGRKEFIIDVQDNTLPELKAFDENWEEIDKELVVKATKPEGADVVFYTKINELNPPDLGAKCFRDEDTPVTPPAVFPIGSTEVTCTATDNADLSGQKKFIVTVVDKDPPVVTVFHLLENGEEVKVDTEIRVEAASPNGAEVAFRVDVDDIDPVNLVAGCIKEDNNEEKEVNSGDTFPIGETLVTCQATDNSDQTGQKIFAIIVEDTIPPVIQVFDKDWIKIDNLLVEVATKPEGADVIFYTQVEDDGSDDLVAQCFKNLNDPVNSGETFPLGETEVTCKTTDDAGYPAQKVFIIEVVDSPPEVTAYEEDWTKIELVYVVEATKPEGAGVIFHTEVDDAVTKGLIAQCFKEGDVPVNSGDTFPIGETEVTCTATDSANLKGQKVFIIKVVDTTPPVISIFDEFWKKVDVYLNAEATGPDGANVIFHVTVKEDATKDLQAQCVKSENEVVKSDDLFPLDETTVTCSATDNAGLTGVKVFIILVQDTTPPETSIISAIDGFGHEIPDGGWSLSLSLSVSFDGDDAVGVVGYDCDLDGAGFIPCDSPELMDELSTGEHHFAVRAFDDAGYVDETPATFSWSILTPEEGLSNLIGDIEDLNLPRGMEKSLTSTLNMALKRLTDQNPNNDEAACNGLSSFLNDVDAKEGSGKLNEDDAAYLREVAVDIQTSQGC